MNTSYTPYKSETNTAILHLFTFQTPIFTALKKIKNVKSILMVLLFLLLFGY